jgi:hypothetical protein
MPGYGSHDTTEEDLASQLPSWMPKDDGSGNWKLLAPIAEQIDHADADRAAVDGALTAQHADTIDQLREIARLVDVTPKQDESLEHYRVRVLAEFQRITSEGTVSDLFGGISIVLDTPVNSLGYTEEHATGGGNCRVTIPSSKLESLAVSDSEFAKIAKGLLATSYRLDLFMPGTFTHITPEEYNAGASDPDRGYDGLDTNGDPKDNGGTYSTVLR